MTNVQWTTSAQILILMLEICKDVNSFIPSYYGIKTLSFSSDIEKSCDTILSLLNANKRQTTVMAPPRSLPIDIFKSTQVLAK